MQRNTMQLLKNGVDMENVQYQGKHFREVSIVSHHLCEKKVLICIEYFWKAV